MALACPELWGSWWPKAETECCLLPASASFPCWWISLSSSPQLIHIHWKQAIRSLFRDIHFIVDKLLITAYLLFPSQGEQSPKVITGYAGGEGAADGSSPFLLCFNWNLHRNWRGFRGPNELFLVTNIDIWSICGCAARNSALYQDECGQLICLLLIMRECFLGMKIVISDDRHHMPPRLWQI